MHSLHRSSFQWHHATTCNSQGSPSGTRCRRWRRGSLVVRFCSSTDLTTSRKELLPRTCNEQRILESTTPRRAAAASLPSATHGHPKLGNTGLTRPGVAAQFHFWVAELQLWVLTRVRRAHNTRITPDGGMTLNGPGERVPMVVSRHRCLRRAFKCKDRSIL